MQFDQRERDAAYGIFITKTQVVPVLEKVVEFVNFKRPIDNLALLSTFSHEKLLGRFDAQLGQYLDTHVIISDLGYTVENEVALVYSKNSLLNLYLSEIFENMAKSKTDKSSSKCYNLTSWIQILYHHHRIQSLSICFCHSLSLMYWLFAI